MTGEEAIERLKTDIYKYADFTENPNENEFWMAFDMAIEALEQEQFDERKKMFAYLDGVADGLNNPLVEPCEDVVSREKALDIVNDYYTMRDITRHEEDNLHEIMEKIENLPSVYPKQKTGHWETRNIFPNWLYCSECDEPYGGNDTPRYCPSCGAKMGEKE